MTALSSFLLAILCIAMFIAMILNLSELIIRRRNVDDFVNVELPRIAREAYLKGYADGVKGITEQIKEE